MFLKQLIFSLLLVIWHAESIDNPVNKAYKNLLKQLANNNEKRMESIIKLEKPTIFDFKKLMNQPVRENDKREDDRDISDDKIHEEPLFYVVLEKSPKTPSALRQAVGWVPDPVIKKMYYGEDTMSRFHCGKRSVPGDGKIAKKLGKCENIGIQNYKDACSTYQCRKLVRLQVYKYRKYIRRTTKSRGTRRTRPPATKPRGRAGAEPTTIGNENTK